MLPSMQARISAIETEFVDIHDTPLKVSRVALDTWAMGTWEKGGTYISECVAIIHAALDQGINLIDTVPLYGFGLSERIIGLVLEGVRGSALANVMRSSGMSTLAYSRKSGDVEQHAHLWFIANRRHRRYQTTSPLRTRCGSLLSTPYSDGSYRDP
jgi:hypothetical protein